MKFRKIETSKIEFRFLVIGDILYFQQKENEAYFIVKREMSSKKEIRYFLKEPIYGISFLKQKKYLFLETSKPSIILSADLEYIYSNQEFCFFVAEGNSDHYVMCYQGEFDREYGLLDIGTLSIDLFQAPFGGRTIIENSVYKFVHQTIYSFSVKTGICLWQTNLSAYCPYTDFMGEEQAGKIEKILGVFQGIVWVAVTNDTLLGLNEQTGEIKYKIREIEGLEHPTYFEQGILDVNKGIIFNLVGRSYCEIDCCTGKVRVGIDLTNYFNQEHIIAHKNQHYDGEYIYFLDGTNTQGSKIGVFQVSTQKLVWTYTFEKDIRIIELQYANNRIYVKDMNNTLYIFEKE